MKVTQKQLTDLLAAAAGVQDVEIVEDEASSDFDMNTTLQAIDNTRTPILRPVIEKEVTTALSGEIGGKLDGYLSKTFGISRAELKDKSDSEKIAMAKEHFSKQFDDKQLDTKKQIEELRELMEKEKADEVQKVAAERDQWKEKHTSRDISAVLKKYVKDLPFKDDVDRDIAIADLQEFLCKTYKLNYDEAASDVSLFDKANPVMPALNGSQIVKIPDIARDFFKPRGMLASDMRESNPANATNQQGKGYVPAGNGPTPVDQSNPVKQLNDAIKTYATQQGVAPAQ